MVDHHMRAALRCAPRGGDVVTRITSVQRTSGDLRVQRRVPCELRRTFDGEWVGSPCIHLEDPARCDGCNGDGNRWVTVGTLHPPRGIGRRATWTPVWFEDGQEFDWADNAADWEGAQALYVIEEAS